MRSSPQDAETAAKTAQIVAARIKASSSMAPLGAQSSQQGLGHQKENGGVAGHGWRGKETCTCK